MKTVLITGGSGYLGQFLVHDLGRDHKVGYTHYSTKLPPFPGNVQDFWVDLKTGEGLTECLTALGPVDAVINCAAISQPAICEKDIAYARSANVPHHLLDALQKHADATGVTPLLIHLSTDQVYDGSRANWKETDPCAPVNAYGQTKLEAEQYIQERWPNHVILRSSIIYGPQSPAPVSRALFLQFIEASLAAGKETTFFNDEWRSPIYVQDILRIVRCLVDGHVTPKHKVYNMGGPERLSRVDMAEFVAARCRFDPALIKPPQSVSSASVNRGVVSPPDISMNIMRLMEDFVMCPLSWRDALDDMRLGGDAEEDPTALLGSG